MPYPTTAYVDSVKTALEGAPHNKTADESEAMTYQSPHCWLLLGKWEADAKSAADSAADLVAGP